MFTTSASAQITTTAYTLDAAVGPINYTGGSVTINPVVQAGPLLHAINIGIDCLDGVCDINNQDWIIFTVSVLSGNVGHVGVALPGPVFGLGLEALGMGYFFEGGPAQDGTGGTATYSASPIAADSDLPVFNFLANGGGGGLTAGTTTLTLFIAFEDGVLPQLPVFPPPGFPGGGLGGANFMVEPTGGSGAATGSGNFTTGITVVPEPSVGLLMGLGLVILGARSRRRSG